MLDAVMFTAWSLTLFIFSVKLANVKKVGNNILLTLYVATERPQCYLVVRGNNKFLSINSGYGNGDPQQSIDPELRVRDRSA